jgi:phosphate uptake regulator
MLKRKDFKMSNMSYCRFRNTLSDLQKCYENMDNDLSEEEQEAKDELISLCKDIAREYGE